MQREEAIKLLQSGNIKLWNDYREAHREWIPDLSGVDLTTIRLASEGKAFDLTNAILFGARLSDRWEDYHDVYCDSRVRTQLHGALVDATSDMPSFIANYGVQFISQSDVERYVSVEQPVVFISYAWADQDVVLAIDQWLRLKRVATMIDRRDFFAGTPIRNEIIRVIQACGVVLIIYSELARDKPWTKFEQELAADLEMDAKVQGRAPPRVIYLVVDGTQLPSVTERMKLAIMAKGKRFELVCEEIYHAVLQIPREGESVDLKKWQDYVF